MTQPEAFRLLPASATSDQVRECIARTRELNETFKLYLLFDAASHSDGLAIMQKHARKAEVRLVNLLGGIPEGDDPQTGWYLASLETDALEVFSYWADPKIQPAAIWLWSTADEAAIAAHLKTFVTVAYGKENSGLLRFADPYVWNVLTSHLRDSIGQPLSVPIGGWWTADMDGGWHATRPSKHSIEKLPTPLIFSDAQIATLEDAMWPIQIYFSLHPTVAQQPACGRRMEKLSAVRDAYRKAKEWGGRDAQDFVTFCGLADEFGADFDQLLMIRNALQAGKKKQQKLALTLRSIPPDDWAGI